MDDEERKAELERVRAESRRLIAAANAPPVEVEPAPVIKEYTFEAEDPVAKWRREADEASERRRMAERIEKQERAAEAATASDEAWNAWCDARIEKLVGLRVDAVIQVVGQAIGEERNDRRNEVEDALRHACAKIRAAGAEELGKVRGEVRGRASATGSAIEKLERRIAELEGDVRQARDALRDVTE
jgi:hypothetical protein